MGRLKIASFHGLGQCYSSFSFEDNEYLVSTGKSLCLQITAEVSKITKSVQCDLIIELSETPNSFVKVRLVLEIRNIVSFIKTRFY